MDDIQAWFVGRLPEAWFKELVVTGDRDEILVMGRLPPPPSDGLDADQLRVAERSRIDGFREDTRPQRMKIADEAQRKFDRKVSWGANCGDSRVLFTHLAVPAMTRLRLKERQLLDTLIDGGVARSRSEALAWCVQLVGQHEAEWLAELRDALANVEVVRDRK
jgi:hypothetical protein